MQQNDLFPKFICIGSQRAGTTWLHMCLDEHPEVFVPETKELHYFDLSFNEDIKDYLSNFSGALGNKASTWGEITPNYYQSHGALERIAELPVKPKIIYILREPVSRAYSQYQLFKQSNYAGLSFSDALEQHEVIIDLSLQGKHLKRTYELFDKDNVLVLFYDELSSNPSSLLKKVYKFLEVDDSFEPEHLNKRMNKVVFPKTQKVLNFLKLESVIELLRKSKYAETIKQLSYRDNKPADLKAQEQTLKRKFASDIDIIEKLTNADLSHWR